jgi:hypothetical protein
MKHPAEAGAHPTSCRRLASQSRRWSAVAAIAIGTVILLTGACERSTPTATEREAIETVVVAYLNDLARAYSDVDANQLSEHATRREMVEVNDRIGQLVAIGERVQATLLQVDITDVQVFRSVNATVSTVEVWDVGRFDAYDGREKGRNPGTVQHGLIQLRKVEGEWKVIGRRVQETQKGADSDAASSSVQLGDGAGETGTGETESVTLPETTAPDQPGQSAQPEDQAARPDDQVGSDG